MTFYVVLLTVVLFSSGLSQPTRSFSKPEGSDESDEPGFPDGPSGRRGPGGHHPPPPPFLKNVSDDARKAFFDIVSNENLTISQIDTQTAAWAATNGVSAIYNEFEANRTVHRAEVKQNVTSVVSNLSSVQSQLETIMDNKDQTRAAQREQIDALKQKYPQEVGIIISIAKPPRRGPGGPGGPGGRGEPRSPSSHIGLPRAE